MPVGSNKISQAVTGAHDGAIFSICVVKDGMLMTGGKDRQLIEWNSAYQRTGRTHEVCDRQADRQTDRMARTDN